MVRHHQYVLVLSLMSALALEVRANQLGRTRCLHVRQGGTFSGVGLLPQCTSVKLGTCTSACGIEPRPVVTVFNQVKGLLQTQMTHSVMKTM